MEPELQNEFNQLKVTVSNIQAELAAVKQSDAIQTKRLNTQRQIIKLGVALYGVGILSAFILFKYEFQDPETKGWLERIAIGAITAGMAATGLTNLVTVKTDEH